MESLKEKYSDADISVIDSKSASMGLGLLVYYANKMIKEGKSKEERFEILSEIAKYQLNILNNAEKIKLLGNGNKEE